MELGFSFSVIKFTTTVFGIIQKKMTHSGTAPQNLEQFNTLCNSSTNCGTVPEKVEQNPKNVEQRPAL